MVEYSLTAEEVNLPARPIDGHKGTFGKVCVFAGSEFMNGACFLCGKAAYRIGAGLVHIFCIKDNLIPLKTMFPEAVLHLLDYDNVTECASKGTVPAQIDEYINKSNCVIIGPGLGTSKEAVCLTEMILRNCKSPLIVDADALNCISLTDKDIALEDIYSNKDLNSILKRDDRPVLITPHPYEMARLLKCKPEEILDDYENIAVSLAQKLNIIVLAKAHESFVTDGTKVYINKTGNTALSKGGSGDVLAGIIGGICAMGDDLFEAAVKGAFIHGLAGEIASEDLTEYGVLASEIIDYIPEAIKEVL